MNIVYTYLYIMNVNIIWIVYTNITYWVYAYIVCMYIQMNIIFIRYTNKISYYICTNNIYDMYDYYIYAINMDNIYYTPMNILEYIYRNIIDATHMNIR